MLDSKVNFPKLKSQSEHRSTRLTTHSRTVNTSKTNTINTINTVPSSHYKLHPFTLQQRLNHLKYKYVNKSPNYFKHLHQHRSPTQFRQKNRNQSQAICHVDYLDSPNQTIQSYVKQQNKILDKEMLMDLARSKVKKIRVKSQNMLKFEQGERQKDGFEMRETKYENFRPMKVQVKRAIQSMHHPNLTLPLHE